MPEQGRPKSFEERVAACSIHRSCSVESYFEETGVPQALRRPFHELVLARGELPKYMSREQGRSFGREARDITLRYKIQPQDAEALRIIFGQLIEQWLGQGAERN